tara:strand:+ start:2551 stop:3231 length:681 start_codon:yes stop_codon:yes gene_type:complete
MEQLNPIKLFFNRIYHFLFIERCSKTLDFKFPKNIYRWNLIMHIIDKYKLNHYLEIGCDKDQCFSHIEAKTKVGVDPISGGTVRETSDIFFKNNKNIFDIIFLDGLHTYEQTKKDVFNSLNILKPGGFILVHDCLPRRISHQAIPRYRGSWNGDVWKLIVELRTLKEIDVFVSKIDYGVGVIRKKLNTNRLDLNLHNYKNLKFLDYVKYNKEYMNIYDYAETLKKI